MTSSIDKTFRSFIRSNERSRSSYKSPNDLLLAQLNELQKQLDNKNAELVQVVEKESQLRSVCDEGELDVHQRSLKNAQLGGFTMKKEMLLKKITFLEDEISKKKKEAGLL